MDKTGNCNFWCSKSGYCGEKEAHKKGVDCRGCSGIERIYVLSVNLDGIFKEPLFIHIYHS